MAFQKGFSFIKVHFKFLIQKDHIIQKQNNSNNRKILKTKNYTCYKHKYRLYIYIENMYERQLILR